MDEVDLAIYDILEKDSYVLDGLDLTESYEDVLAAKMPEEQAASQPTALPEENTSEAADETNIHRKRRNLTISSSIAKSRSSEMEDLKMELLKVEIYHRKLQALKLERELGIAPSCITKEVCNAEEVNFSEQTIMILNDCNE